ncbi:MAG: helix-turn-helix domain-containing protein [Firmicutes bacterium]|nr:helix-turn-helix domain-containing protein [Bacillota bacterium]MCL1954162.1 helix-turn-helix domain-containing protein [Bacillota bacterium]
MTLGQRIAVLRGLKGWKQLELSSKLWQPLEKIVEWESDKGMPDLACMLNLSKLFGVSIDFLLNGDQNTQADRDAASAIVKHDRTINLRQSNIAAMQSCRKILQEHKLPELDQYLPQLSADNLAFVEYGLFDDADLNKFSKSSLLKYNLTDLVLQYFENEISFVDAVKCDDIKVYQVAETNRRKAIVDQEQKNNSAKITHGYAHQLTTKKICGYKDYKKLSKTIGGINTSTTKFLEDRDWALEHLNYDLNDIYKVILHLIDNGAEFFCILEYNKVMEVVQDISKTKYMYRVSKDMIRLIERANNAVEK